MYVETLQTCHAPQATFTAGLLVHDPTRGSPLLTEWITEGLARRVKPGAAGRANALGVDGSRLTEPEADDG